MREPGFSGSMSGTASGVVLVLLGPLSAAVPLCFDFAGWPAVPSLIIATPALVIGLIGGVAELSELGLFRGLSDL